MDYNVLSKYNKKFLQVLYVYRVKLATTCFTKNPDSHEQKLSKALGQGRAECERAQFQ
jgi:hypothetical protein